MKRISVIIPAYNCSAYLSETISSVLNQGVSDLEVLVINDGSTDDTGAVAREFGEPVTVIDQRNSGVCVARNRGLANATGDFVAFLDHDDVWLPNKLLNQLSAFEQSEHVGVVFTNFTRWEMNAAGAFPNASAFSVRPNQGIDDDFSGWIYHQMLLDSHVLTSCALARIGVVRQSGGFDEALPFSEDWDFWLRLSRVCQYLKLREATTLYRQHPTQGSRVIRSLDYRTLLLTRAAKRWGLSSPDGRSVEPKHFRRQLAQYAAEFGLSHLKGEQGADRRLAAKSFVNAMMIDFTYWRSVAYLVLTPLGWKPKW